MAGNTKRFFAVFLAVIIFSASFAFSLPATGISSDLYYGRSALAGMDNASGLLYAYDKIVEGVSSYSSSILIYDSNHSIKTSELQTVYNAYRNDYPQHFWVTNDYSYNYYSDNSVVNIMPVYSMTSADIPVAIKEFEAAVSDYISDITGDMSDYEIQKTIHDRLCNNIVYSLNAENAHNAYGALVDRKAVCDGYSQAYQYLLYRCGIQAHIVTGTSKNSSGQIVGHAWLIVCIDGKYYHSDVTWDDQVNDIFYGYMNLTDSEIQKDHVLFDPGYPLPKCVSTDADYFVVENAYLDTYSVDKIANMMNNPNLKTNVRVSDVADFVKWLEANFAQIAKKLGISAYTGYYSYSSLGEVCIVIQSLSSNSITGHIVSFEYNNAPISVSITEQGSTIPYKTITVYGNYAEYFFNNIKNGTYTVSVSKKGHLPYSDTINVSGQSNFDITLGLYGDVNVNGVLDEFDGVALSRFLAGWNYDIDFDRADVNLDKVISEKDFVMIGRYLAGWNVTLGEK